MKKQTAVEFLVGKIASLIDGEYWCNQLNITEEVKEALKMEREQKAEDFSLGHKLAEITNQLNKIK